MFQIKLKFSFGFVGEGELNIELKKFISLRKNCTYYGYLKNPRLKEVYSSYDVLLLPSIKTGPWEELFGMVLVEAMSCSVVPIATNHSGPKEIIKNNFSGYLFSEDIYVEKTKEILEELNSDKIKLNFFQKNAYTESKKYYAKEIFKKWNQLLNI